MTTKLPLLLLLRLLPLVGVVLVFLQSHQYRHTSSSTVVVHALLIQRQQRHRHVSLSSSSLSKQQQRTPLFLDNNNGSTASSSSSTSSSSTQKEKEQEWIENRKEMKNKQLEWERKLKGNKERKLLSQNNFSQNKEDVHRPGILKKKKKINSIQKEILNNNNDQEDDNDDYDKEDKTNNKDGNNINNKNKEEDNNDDNDEDDDMDDDDSTSTCTHFVSTDAVTFAQAHSAELIALTGSKFNGEALGVGGLEEVITEIKRRVWTPLAAPPSVLQELGVTPVRGVLLYGHSGCGKTLLARTIGKLFSPARPLTVVSGPQLMDKFVGSSEKNLRELFDNPPPVYDPYRISGGRGMDKAALHVILLDEFDAMARTRSGSESDGGAASVARDSVVNQILSKMDGVDLLEVPTLVIAMTNRPSLIDPALLRPGRFEVQIEVPPPSSRQQRISILNVHMTSMQQTGRLKVSDSPNNNNIIGGVNNNNNLLNKEDNDDKMEELVMTYHELLTYLSDRCEGYSGAQLSAIPRAAASRALERAVSLYSVDLDANKNGNKGRQEAVAMFDCVVTIEDLEYAVDDVGRSAATTLVLQNSSSSCSSSSSTTSTTNDSSSSSSSSKRQQQPGVIDSTDNDVVIVPNNGRKEIELEDEELLPPPHDTTKR